MSMSNTFETNLLDHIFTNANIALVGDATGLRSSSAAGSLYVSLHTADPGEAGSQTTSEATYGSYTRVAVVRSSSGWTVSGNSVGNAATVTFPQSTSGSNTITHFGIGTDSSGTGKLIMSGALTSSIIISSGTAPKFDPLALTTTAD